MKRVVALIAFFALTALFTFDFMRNPFEVGDPFDAKQWKPRVFETFQTDTYPAIKQTIEMTRRDGHWPAGGFIYGYPKETDVYDRAFALHVKIYSFLFKRMKLDSASFIKRTELSVSALFGALLAAFVLFVRRHIGWTSAITLTILTCLSDWLVLIARNVDLLFFLRLLPPILSFMLFRHVVKGSRMKFRYFLLILWLAMLFLCLCSNPFITNVVFGVGVGPVFWGLRRNSPFKSIVKWTLAAIAVSASAVAISMIATAVQGYLYFGNTGKAMIVFHAALNRMYGHETQFASYGWSIPQNISVFQIFEQYLTLPMVSLPFYQNQFPGYHIYLSFYSFIVAAVPFSLLSLLDGKRFPRFEANRNLMVSLSATTLYSLGASLSWAFLMKGHMWHHIHQAAVVFYIPYMLFLYILMGCGTALVVAQLFDFIKARKWPSLLNGASSATGAEPKTRPQGKPKSKYR